MRSLMVDSTAKGRIAIREAPEPAPARGEVLGDVQAISLNRGEWRALAAALPTA